MTGSGKRVAVLGGAVGAAAAIAGALLVGRLVLRFVRAGFRSATFAVRLVTLRAYRRCLDCKRVIRADARVCSHCGYRHVAAR